MVAGVPLAEGDRIWYVEQRGRRWGGTVGKRFKGQEGWRRVRKDDGRQVVAEFLPENRGRVWDVVPGGNREVDCLTGYVSIRQDQGVGKYVRAYRNTTDAYQWGHSTMISMRIVL